MSSVGGSACGGKFLCNKEDETFIRDAAAKLDFETVMYSVWVMKAVDLCWKYLRKAEKTFGYSPLKSTAEGLVSTLVWCESMGLL